MNEERKIAIGISRCLLGENVRYDGGNKEDRYLMNVFGSFANWVPVCPEAEMGLPVPREKISLVRKDKKILLIGDTSGKDYTDQMTAWAKKRIEELGSASLCGYILKKNSPSCGMKRVKIYDKGGILKRNGVGMFARRLMEAYPHLPVEEEDRLKDTETLTNFIDRIFAYHRLQQFLRNSPTPRDLVQFHTSHKLILMAHSPVNYRRLGKLVARAGQEPFDQLLSLYAEGFMTAMRFKATRKKHANVLYHVLGYFKKHLSMTEKVECMELIEQYHLGLVPLIVPLTHLKGYLRRYPIQWLETQVYFNLSKEELLVRP